MRFCRGGRSAHSKHKRPVAFVHDAPTRQRFVFAVIDDRQIESARVFHRAAHHRRRRHGPPVVRNRNDAGVFHLAHLGEFRPFRLFRDRANRKHVREIRALCLLDYKARHGRVVIDWMRVGHRANCREAAGDRGRRAAGNRFFVFLPRLAQVHVQVDETGRDDQTGRIDHLGILGNGIAVTLQTNDAPVFDEQTPARVRSLRRVDDVTVFD